MREFVANFQQKHRQQVPMPKIYGDEDSSDSEGLELADGTKVGKKTTGGAGGSGGGKPRKKSAAGGHSSGAGGSGGGGGASAGGCSSPSTSGSGGVGGSGGRKRGQDDDGNGDDPNKRRKTGDEGAPPKLPVARKEPRKAGTVYPPINRNLPVLYISRKKERTILGHRVLDWTPAQLRNDPRGEDAGETGKTPQVQSGDCGFEGHPSLPKNLSTAHPEVAFPEVSEGDRPGLQVRPAVPVGSNTVSPGSSGGIPCQAV